MIQKMCFRTLRIVIVCTTLFLFSGLFVIPQTIASPFQTHELHYIYMQIGNPYITVDGVTMKINESDSCPLIVDEWDRAFIPLKGIVEHIGIDIAWEATTKEVTLSKDESAMETVLQIGNPKAFLNDSEVWIDEENHEVAPFILNDRSYIPVLFTARAFNVDVIWSPDHKFVSLTWKENGS